MKFQAYFCSNQTHENLWAQLHIEAIHFKVMNKFRFYFRIETYTKSVVCEANVKFRHFCCCCSWNYLHLTALWINHRFDKCENEKENEMKPDCMQNRNTIEMCEWIWMKLLSVHTGTHISLQQFASGSAYNVFM